MDEDQRHLHIAILTQGWVRQELAKYLLHLILDSELNKKRDFSVEFYIGNGLEGRPVSSNRNRIVRDRPKGSDLIMLDQDVIPDHRLFEVAQQDLDIVVCPVPIWRPNDPGDCPVRINMNAATDNKVMTLGADRYVEVLQGGTGAIYVSHRVLEHPKMRAPFQFLHDEDGVNFRGEDYNFCLRAKAAGFQVYSANAVLCGHYHEINLLMLMRQWYEMMESLGGGVIEDADQIRTP